MNTYPHYVACAQLAHLSSEENDERLAMARRIATAIGVPYVIVRGAYKGAPETSLDLYGPQAEACARALAVIFEQESYLEIVSYHHAELRAQDGTSLASFTQRVEGDADNYTLDQLGNKYTFV